MKPPGLDDYLQLLEFYQEAIRKDEPTSLQLPLERVFRMLIQPSPFNSSLPTIFIEAARRYLHKKPDALRHFRDPEVQQFFLSDLYDYVKLKALRSQRPDKTPKN